MATQVLETLQYRLAQHYVGKLRQANTALRHNRDNSSHWLQTIEKDWAQIKNWQQWASARSADQLQCAQLCAAFGIVGDEYALVRLSVPERLQWYRQGLDGCSEERRSAKRTGTALSGGYNRISDRGLRGSRTAWEAIAGNRTFPERSSQPRAWMVNYRGYSLASN